jgi:aryl-alcohol dehydrogenase-like predicted oxidoreductase
MLYDSQIRVPLPRRDLMQSPSQRPGRPGRRNFLKALAVAGVGGKTLLRSGNVKAAVDAARTVASVDRWPEMPQRTLGRTGFAASRLVFGCGAALSRGRKDDLLHAAFDAGVNVFDVGFRDYYNDAEKNLAPFLKQVRSRVFLISKAYAELDVEPNDRISPAQARHAAASWTKALDGSLRELDVDHVDAYYLMASYSPALVGSHEILNAASKAKQAGKFKHFGLSTHQNASRVLATAAKTGVYDLAQIAITPAGWYDWADKNILAGSPTMKNLHAELAEARKAGIGLIGMKAGRFLAGRKFLGWGNPAAFDEYYDDPFMKSGFSPYQRSYAYVLEHGLDCVNADMQQLSHLAENFAAAATSGKYFV